MSAAATGGVVFACVFAGALLGILLRRVVPAHHLSEESRESVKVGMGLLATMAALVLGLLIASARSTYDTQSTELTQLAANVVLLDRLLAHYGPETKDARQLLRSAVVRMIDHTDAVKGSASSAMNPRTAGAESFFDLIQALSPQTEDQRFLRAEAVKLSTDLGRTRWLMFVQGGSSTPLPFLEMLIFWLAAIFLIVELDEPFHGVIQVSREQLRTALANLGH